MLFSNFDRVLNRCDIPRRRRSRAISALSQNGNVRVFNGSVGHDHSVSSTPNGGGLAQRLKCEYNPQNTDIRRNEAAIEICMHDVTDFRRLYTVLHESTTAESKTFFSLSCTWELFSRHCNIDLTPPRIHFTTSCQIITQTRFPRR